MTLFNQRLKATMKSKGISQNKLARILGVKQASIWEWCNKSEPSLERFKQICIALQITPNELLGVNEKRDYQDNEDTQHF